jgi:hypothetical protein
VRDLWKNLHKKQSADLSTDDTQKTPVEISVDKNAQKIFSLKSAQKKRFFTYPQFINTDPTDLQDSVSTE